MMVVIMEANETTMLNGAAASEAMTMPGTPLTCVRWPNSIISRCHPLPELTRVLPTDLNCLLVFIPRSQDRVLGLSMMANT